MVTHRITVHPSKPLAVDSADLATEMVNQLGLDLQDPSCHPRSARSVAP